MTPQTPQREISLTDPDARLMKAMCGYLLGYNAQALWLWWCSWLRW
jgi:hypothetical protein